MKSGKYSNMSSISILIDGEQNRRDGSDSRVSAVRRSILVEHENRAHRTILFVIETANEARGDRHAS